MPASARIGSDSITMRRSDRERRAREADARPRRRAIATHAIATIGVTYWKPRR